MAVKNRLVALIGEKQAKTNQTLNASDVAEAVGLSRQAIHRWVHNDIKSYSADTLERLCQYFECQPGDILFYESDARK
jgi:putative transcriptional regulator